jgi:hypothetical protein
VDEGAGHEELGVGFNDGPATYRRRIEVVPGAGRVVAAMEDYIHHFRVALTHDGTTITAAEATPVRVPWSTCPTGAAGLAALAGTSLDAAVRPDRWVDDRRTQCVHTLDLASLAAAHAHDTEPTVYEVRLDLASFTERRGVLERNGETVLDVRMEGQSVVSPDRFVGFGLDRPRFSAWLAATDPPDREPLFVMRRACSIGIGRLMEMDVIAVAGDVRGADDSCHTYRVGIPEVAHRCVGTARETEVDPPGTPIPGGPLEAVGPPPSGSVSAT